MRRARSNVNKVGAVLARPPTQYKNKTIIFGAKLYFCYFQLTRMELQRWQNVINYFCTDNNRTNKSLISEKLEPGTTD